MRYGLGWGNILQAFEGIREDTKRFANRIIQLYEQGAEYIRIGECVSNWMKRFSVGVALQLKPFRILGGGAKYFPLPD